MKLRYLAGFTMMALAAGSASAAEANSVAEAVKQGTVKVDARLRYEMVDQDDAAKDADALTLRTRLTFETAQVNGFSGLIEFEDSRDVFGVNDYNDTNGKNSDHAKIVDPNTTELDQAFIRYQNDMVKATVGRQVITMDNHRFVGHVGWRQDRQTFDGVNLIHTPTKDLSLQYVYINQRNRIFGEEKDVDSEDHLVNLGWKTGLGKLTAYAYLLDNDQVDNDNLDTYGVRFAGKTKAADMPLNYQFEYAMQENEANDADTNYYLAEVGTAFMGVNAKLGYEVLGSDDGKGGFATPLATLHKFNGWADQFLGTPTEGLQDMYINLSTKVLGGKFAVVYHDFTTDHEFAGNTSDDAGSEFDVAFSKKFGKNYNAGIKYAAFSAGDAKFQKVANGVATYKAKVDADKVWIWVGASF